MKLFLIFISSILYVLSFSPFDYKLLIFISMISMFYVLDNSLTRNRIKYIFTFSILVHLIGVSWISESLITYGSINYVISYTITFLLITIISLPYIIIGIFYKSILGNNFVNILFVSSLFVIAEYVKSLFFGGFSWLLLGQSQNQTVFDFIYPIFGSTAVSYIIVLISAIVYKSIIDKTRIYSSVSLILLLSYSSTKLTCSKKKSKK